MGKGGVEVRDVPVELLLLIVAVGLQAGLARRRMRASIASTSAERMKLTESVVEARRRLHKVATAVESKAWRFCGAGGDDADEGRAVAENFKDGGASAKAPFACARPRPHTEFRTSRTDITYSRQEHQHRLLFPTGTLSTLQYSTCLPV
jgi:hypothetical protein